MVDAGNIGRLMLGRGRDSVLTVRVMHDELGREAVLTLREAHMARDRMSKIIEELEDDAPADEVAEGPVPRVRVRKRSRV